MPEKSYWQAAQRRAQIREHYWQAFRRDFAFARYYRENIDEARKYAFELKKSEDARNLHRLARSPYDPEYYVIMGYLQLPEGRNLATRLGLSPAPRSIVRISKMDGPARVLTFEINLAHSVTEIMPALNFTLRRTRRRVLGKLRCLSSPPALLYSITT